MTELQAHPQRGPVPPVVGVKHRSTPAYVYGCRARVAYDAVLSMVDAGYEQHGPWQGRVRWMAVLWTAPMVLVSTIFCWNINDVSMLILACCAAVILQGLGQR